jgi:hypothetical protein
MESPPLLRKGSRGKYVVLLWSLLKLQKTPPQHTADLAMFDDETHNAVVKFQRENQLMCDGLVGPQTWSVLGVVLDAVPIPQGDGTVSAYHAAIRVPLQPSPRIYYVNGIQTDGPTHARTAYALSALTHRVVYGIYNATWAKSTLGMVVDLVQCVFDWLEATGSKVAEIRDSFVRDVVQSVVVKVRKHFEAESVAENDDQKVTRLINLLSYAERKALTSAMFFTNRATKALYHELATHIGEIQYIVAHSQGNLITANALWAMTLLHGETSLANMQVYSLASPVPAWPRGIRYRLRTYHHDNDLVTWFNPHNWSIIWEKVGYARAIGEYDEMPNPPEMFSPHFVFNFGDKSFANDIRRKLDLPELKGWLFPK